MFTNNTSISTNWPGTDYILSECSLVADGLVKIMKACGMRPVVLSSDAQAIPTGTDIRRIVVFLPDAPGKLLNTLQKVAMLLQQADTPLPMLLLSRSPAAWLWQTLTNLVTDHHLLSEVRSAPSDLPVPCLTGLLEDYILERYPSLEQLAQEETRICGTSSGGLTMLELHAILGLLSGFSANEQAKCRGISHKTLYKQRTAGLKKMVKHHPHLAARFPGKKIKEPKTQSCTALSSFEREFIHAIYTHKIFPVFQPITNEEMQIRGIEILSRWHRNDEILLPGEFLPQIHSEYAWLVLTAFVLREAVQNINQHPGDFYFSVNIPAAISSNENLIRMMETAHLQLYQPEMSERLALEFAETIDLNHSGKIAENIAQIRKKGFRIMLDDCFSHSSIIFPVRTIRFSGYKLDISIVSNMLHDSHALALIKSLLYYCKLTDSLCIAEGVDSLEKFSVLKTLGIELFQGYLISVPVERGNLEKLINFKQPDIFS